MQASQVVVTAGPFTEQLVSDLGAKLTVTRQNQIWVEPEKDPEACRLDGQPPFGYFFENEGNVIYGHATLPGAGPAGLKFGDMGSYMGRFGTQEVPEEKDIDNVPDFTSEEIEDFRK